MKRIVIFCDGTWNTPDEMEDGKPCPTNIAKLAKALSPNSDDGIRQQLYYETGIGTAGNKIDRIFDGSTGHGISNKIKQAYIFLVKNYEVGDEIFLFGFSRGSYTVRSIAGFIRNSGILKQDFIDKLDQAYLLYKSRHPRYNPKENEAVLFRKTYSVEDRTPIQFIGVFDTVGALGNPLILKGLFGKKNQFHDTDLSSSIKNAYHAIAIDEKRKNFDVTLWKKQPTSKDQVLEQVWFCGVHSDIGSGYPKAELSDIAINWIIEKAINCNLKFDKIATHPNPNGFMHESRKGFYKLIPKYYRQIGETGSSHEWIHSSVIERYKTNPSYRPKNLVDFINKNPEILSVDSSTHFQIKKGIE